MTAVVTDLNWRQRGACKNEDPEIFFRDSARSIKRAKEICARCPVQAACLTWALNSDDQWSVAAGMTVQERDRLRAVMGRAA